MKVDAVPSSMTESVPALDTRFIATVQVDGVEIVLLIGMRRKVLMVNFLSSRSMVVLGVGQVSLLVIKHHNRKKYCC